MQSPHADLLTMPFSIVLLLAMLVSMPALGKLASGFISASGENRYWAAGPQFRVAFDENGIALERKGRKVRMRLPGGTIRWDAEGPESARINFVGVGNTLSLPAREKLRARSVWPGVDLIVAIRDGRLKTEFHLAAGIPPSQAKYCVEGASIRATGNTLEWNAGEGWQWREERLQSWQDDPIKTLPSRFLVTGQCVSYAVDGVNPAQPLIIDPEIVFSTYVGGGLFDAVTAVSSDASGNTYLGGWTESSDFPSVSGFQASSSGGVDGFVAKLSPTGQLLYATFLGGSGEDRVTGIAISPSGEIVASGHSTSTNFPRLNPG